MCGEWTAGYAFYLSQARKTGKAARGGPLTPLASRNGGAGTAP